MRFPDDIETLVEQTAATYGSLDVLVNGATVRAETTARTATLEDWEFVLATTNEGNARGTRVSL